MSPWGYTESIAIITAIIIVGFILQLTIGNFDFYLLANPVNLIAGGLIILLSFLSLTWKKSNFIRWFIGAKFSVIIIIALLVLSLIMGLTPQTTEANERNVISILGFDAMTSSWPFILIYLTTLISLGCLIVHSIFYRKTKKYAFHINHLGIWLLLFASGLGYADMERYIMYVNEGETQWRVYDNAGNIKELPVAIELTDFDMDVYLPKLAIIDRSSGEVLPKGKPDYFQTDDDITEGILNGWHINVKEYIHNAVRNSDSTYRHVAMPGAAPAALVELNNPETGIRHSRWVSAGNQAQMYMTISLDETQSLVMTASEPRTFTSDINAYTQNGKFKHALIEVNHPLRIGNWTIYQHGYDNKAGRLSSYSSFELVYDAWIIPVYIAIILMMAGSICMIWNGKKGAENDME